MTHTIHRIRSHLGSRSLIFVGFMGAGKTTVGRYIAQILGMTFHDADDEIETISQMTITELFSLYGEEEFRALERRVISNLLQSQSSIVLATGGGAFIQSDTRKIIINSGISIWLKANLDSLIKRVSLTNIRPLLHVVSKRDVIAKLIEKRYPIYAKADIVVENDEISLDETVDSILSILDQYFLS